MANVNDRPGTQGVVPAVGARPAPVPERAASSLSTAELIKEITSQFGHLAKKQLELAKTELRADVRAEVAMASGLGVGAIAALLTVAMLLVALVLALAQKMPGWAAGVIVSGFLLGVALIAALVGWQKRVRSPLARTRQALSDEYGTIRPSHAAHAVAGKDAKDKEGGKRLEPAAPGAVAGAPLTKERVA